MEKHFGAPIEVNDWLGIIQECIWGMRRKDYMLLKLAVTTAIQVRKTVWNIHSLARNGVSIGCLPPVEGIKQEDSRVVAIKLPLDHMSIHISWPTYTDSLICSGPDNVSVCYWLDEHENFARKVLSLARKLIYSSNRVSFGIYARRPKAFLCEIDPNPHPLYPPVGVLIEP